MPEYFRWFVDREKQFKGFEKMLANGTAKRVMLVKAPSELGKTWLIQRIRYHSRENRIATVHIDFRDRIPYDYLALVRRARDQINSPHFNHLTTTINHFTSVNINIGGSAMPGASGIVNLDAGQGTLAVAGDVAGRDIIRDNTFHVQADSDIARRAAEIKINDAFFACLRSIQEREMVVFLFDSFEEVTMEAQQWFDTYFFPQISANRLPNVIVIIAGRDVPQTSIEMKPLTAKTGLDLFTQEHVQEYIEEKRNITGLTIETVFRTSGGFPGLLAKMADLAQVEVEDDDEWL